MSVMSFLIVVSIYSFIPVIWLTWNDFIRFALNVAQFTMRRGFSDRMWLVWVCRLSITAVWSEKSSLIKFPIGIVVYMSSLSLCLGRLGRGSVYSDSGLENLAMRQWCCFWLNVSFQQVPNSICRATVPICVLNIEISCYDSA